MLVDREQTEISIIEAIGEKRNCYLSYLVVITVSELSEKCKE